MPIDYVNMEYETDEDSNKIYQILMKKMKQEEAQYFESKSVRKIKVLKNFKTLTQEDLHKRISSIKGQHKKLEINEKALASYSNISLEEFSFGVYNDNSLSYSIRINSINLFKYLIKRGVRCSESDFNNRNALHFCI